MSIRDNTNRRLKEVLDIMAAGSWLDAKPNGGEVLAEAVARVPFVDEESELLSGGIPRGHKNLTKATADLVKAGWMNKGRSGWEITESGLKATVAFDTVDKLVAALSAGAEAPADTPLPEKPADAPVAKSPAAKAPAKKTATKKAAASAKPSKAAAAEENSTEASDVALENQPASVALVGDFAAAIGAENWDPSQEAVQMLLDAANGVWKLIADLPSGHYSYKVVVNGTWEENYGAYGVHDGANHEFAHDGGPVTFHYNHATKDVLRA